jgi:flagellar L-ring protein precursor FlgH
MKIREFLIIGFLLVFSLTHTGCASFNRKLKAFLGGGSSNTAEAPAAKGNLTTFSENGDLPPRVRRQYKRTTKESLADQSSLDSKSGSLWVMEGQGAYLFSQNIVRMVGDALPVTLEGDPKDQIQSKVNVIRKLVAKIEERQRQRLRDPASTGAEGEEESGAAEKGGKKDKEKDKQKANASASQPEKTTDADLAVKYVPTRIVERTLEGNYRIKGTQPFLIGNREYKIIVTGVVRAEDFNDEGIPASKLLDSKFDIVSARRKEGEM